MTEKTEAKEFAYFSGLVTGRKNERERIIKLLGDECCQSGDCRCSVSIDWLIALIKGENKANHTHDIDVFGAPCDCGTRHEFCVDCDWVEPCECEGENK